MQVAAATTEAEKAAGGVERKRKKTLGRRKIEIKPIGCMEARHVCFSKRRDGLYKKASELCALTGAKVAVIVYSPAGKPYSFGHPSVTAVVDTAAAVSDPVTATAPAASDDAVTALFEVPPPPLLYEFDGQRDRLLEAIAAEARRKDALDAAARVAGVWTDDVVRKAELSDLVAMLAALERVKDDAERAMRQQYAAAAAAVVAVAGGGDAACYYDLVGDGAASFTADEYGGGGASSGGSHQQQVAQAMDAHAHMALLMGGNKGVVSRTAAHAPPPPAYAPMLLPPPDRQPPAPPLAFNYGSDHSHFAGGYEGCAYDLGDGGGHGAATYETEGCYFGAPTATCNFFG